MLNRHDVDEEEIRANSRIRVSRHNSGLSECFEVNGYSKKAGGCEQR